jgi:hypothetical protein
MAIPLGFTGQPEWAGPGQIAFGGGTLFKSKNQFKFIIPSISADSVSSLPPAKSSRPSISFKEIQAEHLNETIFFPGKPEWKPINLTLYDIVKGIENPVMTWLRRVYNPNPAGMTADNGNLGCSGWYPSLGSPPASGTPISGITYNVPGIKVAQCFLVLYDSCGCEIERWVFEHAWPQSVEFAECDMQSNELIYCDLTLRFDRYYVLSPTMQPLTMPISLTDVCSVIPAISFVSFESVPEPEFIALR